MIRGKPEASVVLRTRDTCANSNAVARIAPFDFGPKTSLAPSNEAPTPLALGGDRLPQLEPRASSPQGSLRRIRRRRAHGFR